MGQTFRTDFRNTDLPTVFGTELRSCFSKQAPVPPLETRRVTFKIKGVEMTNKGLVVKTFPNLVGVIGTKVEKETQSRRLYEVFFFYFFFLLFLSVDLPEFFGIFLTLRNCFFETFQRARNKPTYAFVFS